MSANVSNELLQAILTANDQQRRAALRILRGERIEAERPRATERFKTLKEIGDALGFHSTTLWRWGVPGHEFGGRRRFLLSEINEYLESEEFQQRVKALRQQRRSKTKGL